MVKDIYPGSFDSNPVRFTNMNGILFLESTRAANGSELWKSDGIKDL